MRRIVAAITAAIVLTACSGDDDPQVTTEPTSESAAAPETTETEVPDVEDAVAMMLAVDPSMCGTEMDYALSQMAVELGPAYDEAEVTRLVQEMCADYAEPEPTPTPTEEPAPEYAAFGQTYTWEDGLEATVTAPVEFTRTSTAPSPTQPRT